MRPLLPLALLILAACGTASEVATYADAGARVCDPYEAECRLAGCDGGPCVPATCSIRRCSDCSDCTAEECAAACLAAAERYASEICAPDFLPAACAAQLETDRAACRESTTCEALRAIVGR